MYINMENLRPLDVILNIVDSGTLSDYGWKTELFTES